MSPARKPTRKPTIDVVDQFCGAGGTSTGARLAAEELGLDIRIVAINHWEVAIESHSANHPDATHLCTDLDRVDPHAVVPSGRLRLLVASPACTHHSRARGGRPRSDQQRAPAWLIVRWAEALYIDDLLIENVPEFRDWGPLNAKGKPIRRLRGQTYQAFLQALRSLGYKVEDRVLCCANYGDATTRERLFIIARRHPKKHIEWPEPTHTQDGQPTLFGAVQPWRTAREIIDWDLQGESIFNRRKPLCTNTLRRIFAGLAKFGGLRFVLPEEGIYRHNQPQPEGAPLGTVTSRGGGHVVEPCLIKLQGTSTATSIDEPLPTATASGNHLWLCEPFVLNVRGGDDPYTRGAQVDQPLQTATTVNALALIEPFIVEASHTSQPEEACRTHSVDEPLPTATTKQELALAQAFLLPHPHKSGQVDDARSIDRPMPTVTAQSSDFSIVQPVLIEYHGGKNGHRRARSVEEPLPTQDTSNRFGLAQAFLVKYNGTGGPRSVDEPLDALTTNDRYGLVIPHVTPPGYVLDIRYRMIQDYELARAMSFPAGYQFAGKKKDRVKQIGNAVPVLTAKALVKTLLST